MTPRVTLGIATYNRDTYLAEAVTSCLAQDYEDFELLVVQDGTTNPKIDAVLERFDDPRLRVVRHERNRGIAAAYNTFVGEGRGELIAMLGDDDLCLPDRLRRQVAVFDRFPDTGVVHGDATVIDAQGRVTGPWNSRDFTPAALMQSFLRSHNHLVDPTRMVHRRVYDAVGGYDDAYPLANDFDFWLRAAPAFRFRHCAGGPLVKVRRHEANTSDQAARAREIDDVTRALQAAIERHSLRELVPELDWAVLDPAEGERQAWLRLADALDARLLPLPELARELRERSRVHPAPVARSRPGPRGQRLVMTAFGWNDSGGGTTVPRLAAKELARRGWDVTVFHAAVAPTPSRQPYELREWEEDGVRLVGVHNRPVALFDASAPDREIDDPAISLAFGALLDRVDPGVVHFHNLHNLGASLFDHAASRGLPAYFSTHNYWLICPRVYMLNGQGAICAGPGDRGGDCAACVGGHDAPAYQRRLAEIRSRATRSLTACLAVSDAMRRTLMAEGYPGDLIDVVRQAMPMEREIWEQVGRERAPGRTGEELTVGFLGSAYPHKGPQLLVEAAQRTRARLRVQIHGEVPGPFAAQLQALDRRGVVELCGAFAPSELSGRLRGVDVAALPSLWWDCAPLAAAECRAARVPLVVPRLGGLPEAVTDETDGLCFDGLDVDDLVRQLDRLAEEPGLLERLQAGIAPPRSFSQYIDELEAYYAGARPAQAKPTGGPPAVRWVGDHGQSVSLSIVNAQVSGRLPGPVARVQLDGSPAQGDAPLPHIADVEVRHRWPPDLGPAPGGRLAVIQPWEFGAIPRDWVAPLRENVDELWVPSDYVRRMYLAAGLDEDRVVTIPNGVDLDRLAPDGPRLELPDAPGTRFLFVGGLIWRKGQDLLLAAWREAFAGRDDVTLVVKGVGAGGVYRNGDHDDMRAYAGAGELPRVRLIEDDLDDDDLAALYRACDVLVHPYRGEGFAMPVLEAMAAGLPTIVTAGGPTDEFCPPQAGWRIRSTRAEFPSDRVDTLATVGRPWVLEPDPAHLVACLREAAAQPQERRRRGAAGREAARAYDWDAVAARYARRLEGLAARPPLLAGAGAPEALALSGDYALRLLATPAWRGEDALGELLRQWTASTSREDSACLYLLADPQVDGDPARLEQRVVSAADAAGADLDRGADIDVIMEPMRGDRDSRLHAAVDAYVPLHAACAGHRRLAAAAGNALWSLSDGSLADGLARVPPIARVA